MPGNWNHLKGPTFPWYPLLEERIAQGDFPDLNGPVLSLYSDYAGADDRSDYSVICILALDIQKSKEWETRRQEVRSRFLPDNRRMSFKGLNDARCREAFFPFLDAANAIHGLCLSIAIEKSVKNLCTTDEAFQHYKPQLTGQWKLRDFENMTRVTFFVAAVVAALSKPDQDIYWISDHDAILMNPRRQADAIKMLGKWTGLYVPHPLGEVGAGTVAIDPGDHADEDLASIADLVAGGVAEAVTAITRKGPLPPRHPITETFSLKTEFMNNWFMDSSQPLKRLGCLIQRHPSGQGFRVGTWKIDDAAEPSN